MTASDEAPVGTLRGIGPATQSRLAQAGVGTAGDLRRLGAIDAYRRIKFMAPDRVTVNALYALEAALRGCHWLELSAQVRETLRLEAAAIDAALRQAMAPRGRLR